ncbi:hypothetical protein Poli38472_001906 [Pythium oligandrum]|uniref:Ankyrin repeat protein n=1 Tax=Pythium oligandrum TaxID=41045 RepID=A0A8K1FMU4_PYTOL|nr:hypothetical protein Poli38472_001906 [Pythium oligandrum]|eukprot:TMW69750.1 hypothetical protein Poli38472_001906 [Pythium oligandrum]
MKKERCDAASGVESIELDATVVATIRFKAVPPQLLEVDIALCDAAAAGQVDMYNSTPLFVAATGGCTGAVDTLLKHGAEISCSVLYETCHYGQAEAVAILLDHGAKVFANTGQQNPMCAAARPGSVKILELLHECGFDINPSDQGMISTPLHEASEIGYVAVVEWLLTHGANVDATDGAGKTSLHHAVNRRHSDVVTSLLDHGAQADIQDTVRSYRASRGKYDIVQLLLANVSNTQRNLTVTS